MTGCADMKKIIKILILLILTGIISVVMLNFLFPLKYINEIEAASLKYGIPPETILAMAKAESNFREKVVSKKGAVGVMQVLPSTAKWYVEKKQESYIKSELYDCGRNIDIGTGYFKYLYDDFKDMDTALAAYNAGPNRVKEKGWGNIRETQKYVKKVKKYTKIYKVILKIKRIEFGK